VVSFLSDNVQFSGNHNIWTPVCYGLGLKSRLHRLAGDCHFAAAALNRIVAHPINAALPRDVLLKKLAALPLELEKGFCDKSQKWSCHILARALASICYYRETGVPALPQSSWYSAQELEPLLLSGLEKLRERLQTA